MKLISKLDVIDESRFTSTVVPTRHTWHPREPARPFSPRTTSATSFVPFSRRLLLVLNCSSTAHTGSTCRCLRRFDRRGADNFEAYRGSATLQRDLVDRHVPISAADTASTTDPRSAVAQSPPTAVEIPPPCSPWLR